MCLKADVHYKLLQADSELKNNVSNKVFIFDINHPWFKTHCLCGWDDDEHKKITITQVKHMKKTQMLRFTSFSQ